MSAEIKSRPTPKPSGLRAENLRAVGGPWCGVELCMTGSGDFGEVTTNGLVVDTFISEARISCDIPRQVTAASPARVHQYERTTINGRMVLLHCGIRAAMPPR